MGLDFAACVRAHYEGKLGLREFFLQTAPAVEQICAKLLRHWHAPTAVEVADVAQEFRIGCVRAFKRYDATRSDAAPIDRYVLFNACDKAKKWIHRQRGARLHGNPDSAEPRYDVLFSSFTRSAQQGEHRIAVEESMTAYLEWRQPTAETPQETTVGRREAYRKLLRHAPTKRIAWAMLALEATNGEVDSAAARLYGDQRIRLRLRLGSLAQADRIVQMAIRYMARAA